MLWKLELWQQEVSVDSCKLTNKSIEMETTPTKTAQTNPIVDKPTWWSRYQSVLLPQFVRGMQRNGPTRWQTPNSTHTHTQFVLTLLFAVLFGSAHGAICNCLSCVPMNCETIRLESRPRSQFQVQMSGSFALFLLNNLQWLKFKSMIILVNVEET